MSRKFCANQIQCRDRPKETYTCMGHLAEGHAFDCKYNESEIYLDSFKNINDEIRYRFGIAKQDLGHCYSGICEDFDILPKIEEELNIKYKISKQKPL